MTTALAARYQKIGKIALLLMLCSLTGCLKDRGALLAQCRLKYEGGATDRDLSGNHDSVFLCMRASGYEFESRSDAIDAGQAGRGIHCFTTAPSDPKTPVTEIYDFPECYRSITKIDRLLEKITDDR